MIAPLTQDQDYAGYETLLYLYSANDNGGSEAPELEVADLSAVPEVSTSILSLFALLLFTLKRK